MQASSPVVLKIKQNVQREQVWDSKLNNRVFGFNPFTKVTNTLSDDGYEIYNDFYPLPFNPCP